LRIIRWRWRVLFLVPMLGRCAGGQEQGVKASGSGREPGCITCNQLAVICQEQLRRGSSSLSEFEIQSRAKTPNKLQLIYLLPNKPQSSVQVSLLQREVYFSQGRPRVTGAPSLSLAIPFPTPLIFTLRVKTRERQFTSSGLNLNYR
jgi:hypothetical protein